MLAAPDAPDAPDAPAAPAASDEEEPGDDDDYVPAPKPLPSAATRCDYACERAEMTDADVLAGYCSGRRCKSKLHHFCFLGHAGVAVEALSAGTRFCRACWAKHV